MKALSFPDRVSPPPDGDWTSWAREHAPPALFSSAWSGRAVHGYESLCRLGGVVAQPADLVLGIRAFDDAFEGTLDLDTHATPVPFVLFEIEKIARMMLHQSGLAFEILASPAVLHGEHFPARRIIESAVTTDILHHFRDVASGLMRRLVDSKGQGARPADVLDAARNALTGRALADGQVAFDVWALADEYGSSGLLRQVESQKEITPDLLDEVSEHVTHLLDDTHALQAKLPARPQDYDWLNDFVVSCRHGHQ